MLNRRLLRVKVMQVLYAHYYDTETSIHVINKELIHSISKSFDLYYIYLQLLTEVRNYAIRRIEYMQSRKTVDTDTVNLLTSFVNNKAIVKIDNSNEIKIYCEQYGNIWLNKPEVVKDVFTAIRNWKGFEEYLNEENKDFDSDKRFVIKIFEKVIFYDFDLYNLFEEMNIYWNDEIEFILSIIIKMLKSCKENEAIELTSEKDCDDDKNFACDLLKYTHSHKQNIKDLITKYSKNWDFDRVAVMDIIILEMAMAEILNFKSIPLKVSVNEYIEIAKHYSTERSNIFINGLLEKIIKDYQKEGKINKS